jgi:hypothetical protein
MAHVARGAGAQANFFLIVLRHKRRPFNRHPEELGAHFFCAPSVSKADSPDRPQIRAESFEARSLMLARASG